MSGLELQFNVGEISEVPSTLSFRRSADWGSSILQDGVYELVGDIACQGQVRRIDKDLLLELEVRASLQFHCSRCGEPADMKYRYQVNHLFVAGSGDEVVLPPGVDLDPELDISEIEGAQCEAESVLVALFASDLPAYPICDAACELSGPNKQDEENQNSELDPRLAPLLSIREAMAQHSASPQKDI